MVKASRKSICRKGRFFVYILECLNGTYYTGYTSDLENRIEEHNGNKRGAKYLRGKKPFKVVYVKEYKYFKRALNAERNVKKLTRGRKKELIRIYGKNVESFK